MACKFSRLIEVAFGFRRRWYLARKLMSKSQAPTKLVTLSAGCLGEGVLEMYFPVFRVSKPEFNKAKFAFDESSFGRTVFFL